MQIKDLYNQDQDIRKGNYANKTTDTELRKEAFSIIFSTKSFYNKEEWFYFGHLYHHGTKVSHAFVAIFSSTISFLLGFERAKNLFALSLDRLLMKLDIKQIFGTQIFKKDEHSKWIVYKSFKISDKIKKYFLCDTEEEMQNIVDSLNKNPNNP
jgi:hypothetical protein